METDNRWDEVAVAIRIVRNAASTHIANRLREVYREYLEKYAHAVSQVKFCATQASFTVLENQLCGFRDRGQPDLSSTSLTLGAATHRGSSLSRGVCVCASARARDVSVGDRA